MTGLYLAFAFSAAAIAGSLYLSLGMGLNACPLCFYQRTFAFALFAVLGLGLATLGDYRRRLIVLCLPLAVGGLGVAAFHSYLTLSGQLECPAGIAGLGSAPVQSLAIYVLILGALIYGFLSDIQANGVAPTLLALALGGAAVYGSIVANPAPPVPKEPYPADVPVKTCRVPYTPVTSPGSSTP
jgi:disulfide bond formation protein DsbB